MCEVKQVRSLGHALTVFDPPATVRFEPWMAMDVMTAVDRALFASVEVGSVAGERDQVGHLKGEWGLGQEVLKEPTEPRALASGGRPPSTLPHEPPLPHGRGSVWGCRSVISSFCHTTASYSQEPER